MEQLRNLRWRWVAGSLVATVALLLGASWGLRAVTREEPLQGFLRSQPEVLGYAEDTVAGTRVLRVELRDMPDLSRTYRHLHEGVARILGGEPFRLEVADRRTPALEEAFYRINPLLQEALATGRYGDLLDRVEERSRTLGLDRVRVFIDPERLYLQLHEGSDYLYAVLPRPDGPAGRR